MKNKELKREMKRKKHLKYIPWQSQDDPNNIDYDSLCEKRSLKNFIGHRTKKSATGSGMNKKK